MPCTNLLSHISKITRQFRLLAEIEVIKEVLVPKKIRKRKYFLQEGQVCKYAAFIVKGAMRQYSVDDKGVEQIVGLFIENW